MEKNFSEVIIRHSRLPQNKKRIPNPDHTFDAENPSCGDHVIFDVTTDKRGRIKSVGWDGSGCVISMASASVFSQMIQGKTLKEVQDMNGDLILQKIGMKLSPSRHKCAVLALFCIKQSWQ